MNIWDFLILAIIAVCAAAAVRQMKKKKSCGCGCGSGCSACREKECKEYTVHTSGKEKKGYGK